MDIDKILVPTTKLFEAIEVYKTSMTLRPEGEHYASHIKLLDFKFNRNHLITRLREAIIDWVFSKDEANRIFNEEFGADEDRNAASTALYISARETIRIEAPQGQFGELVLSGFLRHLFQAAPLLRKQAVRTSDNLERFGADAIHISGGKPTKLYLGESKCYTSKYRFASAFKASIESMHTTVENFDSEIKKFRTGNFIEEELKPIALSILKNEIDDLEVHPVCMVIYNETEKLNGNGSRERKEEIRKAIMTRCNNITPDSYDAIDEAILRRCIYIIFPVWDLDKLLDDFTKAL